MKIHSIHHVEFEGLGVIEKWIKNKNQSLSSTQLYASQNLPEINDFDCLIVMGGPMGIYDDKDYPWLTNEKKLIDKAIVAQKTVIGICLGAQLIADVLGAEVYPNKHKEIGWFPIELTSEGKSHPYLSDIPETFDAFHWHGDTFTLPDNAVHLAESSVCKNQAFAHGNNVLALQFHLEATPLSAAGITQNCSNELIDKPYIQSEKLILSDNSRFDEINKIMFTILDNIEI